MERLTFRDDEMQCECPVRCNEDDDVSQFCNQVCDEWQSNCPYMNMGKKLKHYEDLDEKGLLVELPCNVGDSVYFIKAYLSYCKEPIEEKVDRIIITNIVTFKTENRTFCLNDIGTKVFLTKSEAEQALER